jgi:hypothetical protein
MGRMPVMGLHWCGIMAGEGLCIPFESCSCCVPGCTISHSTATMAWLQKLFRIKNTTKLQYVCALWSPSVIGVSAWKTSGQPY